jgi:endonuclease-3
MNALAKPGRTKVLEDLLPDDFTAQDVYDHHQVMMKHGQKVCFYNRPACRECVLLELCPTGQKLMHVKVE